MNQWGDTPSGAQTRSYFSGSNQPERYCGARSQQSPSSQTPDQSSTRQSSQDSYQSIHDNPRTRFAGWPRITPEILTHLTPAPQATSASFTLPSLSPQSSAAYTVRPIALPSPGSAHFGNLTPVKQSNNSKSQTFQQKNANLVSTCSSAPVRSADFDQEAHTSKLETTKLVKDQRRLRAKNEALEAEINELHANIEVAQQHTAARDAQYSQMVELSTKLQSHGIADVRRHRAQQEQWAREKRDMERLIAVMKSEIESLRSDSRSSTAPQLDMSGLPTDSLAITDVGGLETLSKTNMQDALSTLQKDHAHLVDYLEKLGNIGRKMQTHLQNLGTEAANVLDD